MHHLIYKINVQAIASPCLSLARRSKPLMLKSLPLPTSRLHAKYDAEKIRKRRQILREKQTIRKQTSIREM